MAKKIYNVTFANGTVEEYTNKKAIKALEGVVQVVVNGEDITNEFIKEDEVMARTEYVEVPEVIETIEPEVTEPEVIEGPKNTILFTASRGTAKNLNWYQIEVNPEDELVKAKGCAALMPTQVAEVLGKDKFVAWIDRAIVEQFLIEGKPVRGMASTISDVFNRYCKVTELRGADKNNTVYNIFRGILEDLDAGRTEGGWNREIEVAEEGAEDIVA